MKALAAAFVVLLTLGSCRTEHEGTVIARVGDATLTREAAMRSVDTTRGALDRQLRAAVVAWVNTELLHQEALKRGIEASEGFMKQLDEVKRQLAVQALLDADLLADSTAVSDDSLKAYFTAHAGEFFLREDMAQLNIIVLAGREEASRFAAAVSEGTAWKTAADKLVADSAAAPSVRFSAAGEFYSRRTLSPPELWKVASTLSAGEVSIPVRVSDGFAVLQLLSRLGEGKAAEFAYVRDEVGQRLTMERRRTLHDALLARLRSTVKIQVMLSPASASDTTQQLPHE